MFEPHPPSGYHPIFDWGFGGPAQRHDDPREPRGADLLDALREGERRAKAAEDRPALEKLWAQIKALMRGGPHA